MTNLNCVFISYTPQKLCYYNANYSKNIVLFGKRVEAHSLHVNTDVFNTVDRKRHRFLAFLECFLSKTYPNEYQMNKNGHTGSDIDAC